MQLALSGDSRSGGQQRESRNVRAVRRSGRRSATFVAAGRWFNSSCSRIQVSPWGTKMACRPAARAGLMSDFGLLPTIQVESCARSYFSTTLRVGSRILSRPRFRSRRNILFSPERSTFPDCSATAPLVSRIRRWRCERYCSVSRNFGKKFDRMVRYVNWRSSESVRAARA